MEKPAILLVDDDADLADMIKLECEQFGYRVEMVHDGEAAWRVLKKKSVVAVISDVQMPGMSGNELINMARSNGIMTPFIFMSGVHGTESVFQALRAGACDFLQKPIRPEVLRKVVPRAVDLGIRQSKIESILAGMIKSEPRIAAMVKEIESLTAEMGRIIALGAQGEWEAI